MIDIAREFADEQGMPIRIGVSCGLGAVPAWKFDADAWYLQVSYDLDAMLDRLDADPDAGVDLAVELVLGVRDSNAFDGVHLIPVNRYRQVAAALEPALR